MAILFVEICLLLDDEDSLKSDSGFGFDLKKVGFVGTRGSLIKTENSNPSRSQFFR